MRRVSNSIYFLATLMYYENSIYLNVNIPHICVEVSNEMLFVLLNIKVFISFLKHIYGEKEERWYVYVFLKEK